jgi:hypothetical protein
MMGPLPSYQVHPRRYARRLAALYVRDSTLSVRVTAQMKDSLAHMAACRGMSLCEYAARVINDHLLAANAGNV